MNDTNLTRINKFLSEIGYCSRRAADKLIEQGRVKINGEVPEMGTKISADDEVSVNGKVVHRAKKKKMVYIAFNKPVGIVCTTDQMREKNNIIDYINYPTRIFPIGRLDKPSEGLIFLTNDGDIVNKILRARNNHEKEYLVGVNKPVNDIFLRAMARGVRIHRQVTLPCKVSKLAKYGFRIVLTQGLNRQIRLMAEVLGYKVVQLRRTRIVNVKLGTLKPGVWRNLSDSELSGLLPDFTDW